MTPAFGDRALFGLEDRVRRWVEGLLHGKRLAHVRGTVEAADRLARRHVPDSVEIVRVAAWLHDVARAWEPSDLLDHAKRRRLPILPSERENPMLLHGAVGYDLAQEQLGFRDPRIETACRFHTVGAPGMTATDKVLFLADFVEPTRHYPDVDRLREEAEKGLDEAVLLAIDMSVTWLMEKQSIIDPRPLALRNLLIRSGVRHEPWCDRSPSKPLEERHTLSQDV